MALARSPAIACSMRSTSMGTRGSSGQRLSSTRISFSWSLEASSTTAACTIAQGSVATRCGRKGCRYETSAVTQRPSLAETLRPTVSVASRPRCNPRAHLDADHDNLLAALAWSSTDGDITRFLSLASALESYWMFSGRLVEASIWLDEAATRRDLALPAVRLPLLRAVGWNARGRGDLDRAEHLGNDALLLAREVDDQTSVADALILLGFVAEDRAAFARAYELHAEARRVARQAGERLIEAFALLYAGWQVYLPGDLSVAEQLLLEALAVFEGRTPLALPVPLWSTVISETLPFSEGSMPRRPSGGRSDWLKPGMPGGFAGRWRPLRTLPSPMGRQRGVSS